MITVHALSRSSILSYILLLTFLYLASREPPEPRMFMPMPKFRPIPITLPTSVCTPSTPFLALLLILSHPANLDKRDKVRRTYPVEEIASLGYRRVFILGTMEGGGEEALSYRNINVSDKAIQAENDQHGDILQLSHPELYNDLILKTFAAFHWAKEECAHAKFIVKNDDDMFFDYYQMERTLRRVPDYELDFNIFGNVVVDTWNLTPYLAGGSYFMSPKTMEYLLDTVIQTEPPIKPFSHFAEDVYFTGLVADAVGIARVDVEMIRSWQGKPYCCVADDGGAFQCQFSVFMQKPLQLPIELLLRYKEHGKMCYYFHCDRFSSQLLERKDVKCFRE